MGLGVVKKDRNGLTGNLVPDKFCIHFFGS